MRIFGKLGGTKQQFRAAYMTPIFDLAFGAPPAPPPAIPGDQCLLGRAQPVQSLIARAVVTQALMARVAVTQQYVSRYSMPCTAQTGSDLSVPGIKYVLTEPGYVSIAVYSSDGKTMIRPLSYGQYMAAGTYAVSWDGLDRYGNAQTKGTYSWKALVTPGFSRRLIANLGVQHPWSPFDQLPGNHSGPTSFYVSVNPVVQTSGSTSTASGSQLASIPFGIASTNGNSLLIAVVIDTAAGVTVSSVTDNASPSNAYTRDGLIADPSGNNTLEIWRASNIAGSPTTVTVKTSATTFITILGTMEVNGLQSSPVDGAGSTNQGSGNTTTSNITVTTGAFSTGNAYDLVIAGFGSGRLVSVASTPSGFSQVGTEASGGTVEDGSFYYEVVSSTQSGINPSWSVNGNGRWGALALAYKLSTNAGERYYLCANSAEGPPHIVSMTPNADITQWVNNWSDGNNSTLDGFSGMAMIASSDGSRFPLHLFVFNNGFIPANNATVFVFGSALGNNTSHSYSLLHSGDSQSAPSPMQFAPSPGYGLATGIIVSYESYNGVRFITPSFNVGTGVTTFTTDTTVTVTAPTYLAARNDGSAYVVSGTSVQKVTSGGSVTTIISGLTSPGPIAYDALNDDILVAINSNYVARYHSDGTFKQNYGNTSGRSYGTYVNTDFGQILSLYCDNGGNWFATDRWPRRTAAFNSSGTLLWELAGGLDWSGIGAVDPADTTTCYLPLDNRHLAQCSITASTQTWSIVKLFDIPDQSSYGGSGGITRNVYPGAGQQTPWEVRNVGGQKFLLNRGGRGVLGQDASVVLLRIDATKLTPVAAVMCLHPTIDYNSPPSWWVAAGGQTSGGHAASYTNFTAYWYDANGNGLVDQSEINLASVGNIYLTATRAVDANWNIWLNYNGLKKIPNEGTLTAPIWNPDHWQSVTINYSASESAALTNADPVGAVVCADGNVCLAINATPDVHDTPPDAWPDLLYGVTRLIKVDPTTGNVLFSVGVHSDSPEQQNGQLQQGKLGSLRGMGALADGNIVVIDSDTPGFVFTQDGLYAGGLRDDIGLGSQTQNWQKLAYGSQQYLDSNNAIITANENDTGFANIVTDPSGNVFVGQEVWQAMAMYEMSGFSGWLELSGTITLASAPSAASSTGTGLTANYYSSTDLSGAPTLTEVDSQIHFGQLTGAFLTVTGYPSWPNSPSGAFSAQWTGEIELPLGEQVKLVAFVYGSGSIGCRVKVIVGGVTVIDEWNSVTLGTVGGNLITQKFTSSTIGGTVGKLPITVQFAAPNDPTKVHLHLYWESVNLDLLHVPQKYLYSS